jgi:2-phospho-L-lactate guanylyltransferase
MATRAAEDAGADFTLVLPGDIPLVTATEIRLVLDAAPQRGTVFVRAADARGTNAVLRRPASLFPLRFGNDSFLPHLASAQATGLPVELRQAPGIALDIDRPDDLTALMSMPVTTATQRLLCAWGFSTSR